MKGRNLNGIVAVMIAFEGTKQGSTEFWKRMEQLLEKEVKAKRNPLDKDQVLNILRVAASKRITSEDILRGLLNDVEVQFEGKFMSLDDVHSFVKSIDGLDMLEEESINMIIDYVVDKGYDGEDFAKQLGLARGTSLICRLLSVEPNKIQSPNFIVHVEDFVRDNLTTFTRH